MPHISKSPWVVIKPAVVQGLNPAVAAECVLMSERSVCPWSFLLPQSSFPTWSVCLFLIRKSIGVDSSAVCVRFLEAQRRPELPPAAKITQPPIYNYNRLEYVGPPSEEFYSEMRCQTFEKKHKRDVKHSRKCELRFQGVVCFSLKFKKKTSCK